MKDKILDVLKDAKIENCEVKVLEDIKKKDKILEKRDGFIIYSKETIEDANLTELYAKLCKKECQERNLYRYYYYEKVNDSPLHATIIMMNPAFADSQNPDETIKNIKNYLNNKDVGIFKHIPNVYNNFGSFDIVNLYPVRLPDSTVLPELLDKTKPKTLRYQKFVKAYLNNHCKNNVIIAAWGSNKKDNEQARILFENSNIKFYCYGITKESCPKHFASLSYNRFDKFRTPMPYINLGNWLKDKTQYSEYDNLALERVKHFKEWLSVTNITYMSEHYNALLDKVFSEVE